MNRKLLGAAMTLVAAAALSGCNGTSNPSVPAASFTPLPVLVAGNSYSYTGTSSETITYASPSPTQVDSDGAYTVHEDETVWVAPSSAPAPFEVRRNLKYSVTKKPVSGIELQRRTIVNFESSTTTASSQTISLAASTTKSLGVDLDAGRIAGNGPYAYTDKIGRASCRERV